MRRATRKLLGRPDVALAIAIIYLMAVYVIWREGKSRR
jgi:hypothetical protein